MSPKASNRFACDLDATIVIDPSNRIEARATDINYGGICLFTHCAIESRRPIQLLLRLVTAEGTSDPLEVAAEVAWCAQIGSEYQVGARFSGARDDVWWEKLDALLRVLLGEIALPSRP